MNKLTTEIFIERAREIHKNKYNYELVEYAGSKIKVKIICPEHGEFLQAPGNHLRHIGCPHCTKNAKGTTEDFVEKAKKIHGDTYSYTLVKYKNNSTKVKIICSVHGIFEQQPNNHFQGKGCQKCAGNSKDTLEEFVKKSKKVHGDIYNYSNVIYINTITKVKITCPKHGIFEQTPNTHLCGAGCPKCAGNISITLEEFIKKSKEVHGNIYNYSLVEYINCETKVKIICPKHGVFKQIPYLHYNGSGCKKCSDINKGISLSKSTKSFIVQAEIVHGDIYDYSLVEYANSHKKIKIICPIHGEFEQTPSNHLKNRGCPRCNSSRGESQIRKNLKKLNIKFKEQKTFDGCRNICLLPFDFYLEDFNMCIEFDGVQHFKPIEFFGGQKDFENRLRNDKIKNEYCLENNIRLKRIKYNENIDSIIKELFL